MVTVMMRALLFFAVLVQVCECRDLAICSHRTRACNGDYFCTDICTKGTVLVEDYSRIALTLQRNLQKKEVVARNTFLGSHNSAISQAYGFGIEMDGIEKLLNITLYDNDDIGEGVDQNFAITDQLNMGLRHIEIDITAGYFLFPPKINEIFVCHSPVPLDPSVILKIELAATKQGVKLGDWKADKLSCLGTRVPFQTMLEEIKDWLVANPDEFVILFLDTKPLTVVTKAQANAASKVMRDVFGDMIFAKSEGNVLNKTIEELLAAGKRLFFEDHDDGYNKADDVIVFTPDVWSHQFDDPDLVAFPNCSIQGDSHWYTPVGAPAKNMVRGLYDDGSDLDSGVVANSSVRRKAMECGVNIVSPNYVQPLDVHDFVWTWGSGEPRSGVGRCVVQVPAGTWAVRTCAQARALPLACRARSDDTRWQVHAPGAACPEGYVAVPPTNGFANAWLREAAGGKAVWLNVSVDGLGPAPVNASMVLD